MTGIDFAPGTDWRVRIRDVSGNSTYVKGTFNYYLVDA